MVCDTLKLSDVRQNIVRRTTSTTFITSWHFFTLLTKTPVTYKKNSSPFRFVQLFPHFKFLLSVFRLKIIRHETQTFVIFRHFIACKHYFRIQTSWRHQMCDNGRLHRSGKFKFCNILTMIKKEIEANDIFYYL